jgi:class 3 adenylate cyclase/tetratricopeptide (TPR) repeat protein
MDTRASEPRDGDADTEILCFGDLVFDPVGHVLRDAGGREIRLTPAEFLLLEVFLRSPGRALSRDHLMNEVAGRTAESYDRSIDVLVLRLRRKIERNPGKPELIVTLPRVGYRFTARPRRERALAGRSAPAPHDDRDPGQASTSQHAAPVDPAEGPTHSGRLPQGSRPVERRQVTVFSCEFSGLAALATRVDPEDFGMLAAARRKCCADVIERFGGTVGPHTGDGLTAYFGYPQAHEHDAERAVRAALVAIEAIAALGGGESPNITARIGIASGPVVAGDLTGSDKGYSLVGETAALAAALRMRAAAGTVLVSPGTHRLIGRLFEYRALAPFQIDGGVEPTAAFQVIADSTGTRFQALREAAGAALVGRDDEIELLERLWRQAQSAEGSVVLIAGEAGIGKSRLCAALAERIGSQPHAVVSCQCSPHHPDSALHPVISVLEGAAGFAREDSPHQKRAKLEALLGSEHTDAKVLLAHLVGVPAGALPDTTPQRRKQRMLDAIIAYLAHAAAVQPLLLLFEDAHWVDPTSLELLALLIDRIQRLPILLIVTARPEFAPPWPAYSHVKVIALSRLGHRDAAALISHVAGRPLPEQMVEEILLRTDCVPLFVEELTKAIVEGGHLVDTGERYELAGPLPLSTIPTTLQDSLTARLDRLEHGKQVAQVGAAIGREFPHAILAAALPGEAPALGRALDELVRSELVFRHGAPPDAVYTFKHALVRDAAYHGMPRALRQACHGRIAAAILHDEPDTAASRPELLAYHHQQAGEDVPALRFWREAGDLAVRRLAAREAASHYRSAIALLPRIPEAQERFELEFDLCTKLANTLMQFQGFTSSEAVEYHARACAISFERGDMERYAEALAVGLSALAAFNSDPSSDHVRARRDESLAPLESIDAAQLSRLTPAAGIRIQAVKAVADFNLARLDAAWQSIAPAIARDDAAPCTAARPLFGMDPAIVLRAYGQLVRWCQGQLLPAALLAGESVRIAESRGSPFSLCGARYFEARAVIMLGRYAEAETLLTQAIAVCNRHGFEARRAVCVLWHAIALARLGRMDDAVASVRAAGTAWASALGNANFTLNATEAVDAFHAGGAHDIAEEILVIAEGDAMQAPRLQIARAELLRVRGELLGLRGEQRAAEERLRAALQLARGQSARLFELRAARELARLMHATGRDDEAGALLRPVYDTFSDCLDAPDLQRAADVLDTLRSAR